MDWASIVEVTERTRFCPQTDGETDGRIPPFQLYWSSGYENTVIMEQINCTQPYQQHWLCVQNEFIIKPWKIQIYLQVPWLIALQLWLEHVEQHDWSGPVTNAGLVREVMMNAPDLDWPTCIVTLMCCSVRIGRISFQQCFHDMSLGIRSHLLDLSDRCMLSPGGGTRPENWWGCAAGRWKLDPKRSRKKLNLGPKRSIFVKIGSFCTPKDSFAVGGWEKYPKKIVLDPAKVKKGGQNRGTYVSPIT